MCHSLLGGVIMTIVCAPLRAAGETLGPTFWIGRRRRLGVVLKHEGVVLLAHGVLDSNLEILVVLLLD